VLQADGGTRTLSVCAGFCALYSACRNLQKQGLLQRIPLRQFIAAISVGIVNEEVYADLCYEEDSSAEVDANIVATGDGKLIELQMTAEREPLSDEQFSKLVSLGKEKTAEIIALMKNTLRG